MEIAAIVAAVKKILELLSDSKKTMSLLRGLFSFSPGKLKKTKLSDEQAEFKRVAEAAIRAKNMKIQRQNELNRMDEVHGFGTSALIIEAEKAEEKAKAKRRKREQRKKEKRAELKARLFYFLKEFLKLVTIIGIAAFIAWVIWANRCTSGNC